MSGTLDDRRLEDVERFVVELLAAATGSEAPKIASAAVRAGMMWRCTYRPCGQPNYPTHTTCAHCREPRGPERQP